LEDHQVHTVSRGRFFTAAALCASLPLAGCSGIGSGQTPGPASLGNSVGTSSLAHKLTDSKPATPLLYLSDESAVYIYDQVKGAKPINKLTGFSDAFGVAVAPSGDIYVADLGAQAVDVFHQGQPTPYEILTGATDPAGVALDTQGNVYANNWVGNEVYVWAAGSTTVTSTLVDTACVNSCESNFMAVDAAGDVVIDYPGGQLDEFPAGAGSTPIELQSSTGNCEGLAFDGQQNLVVSNENVGFNIYAPPYTGKPTKTVKGKFEMQALAFTSDDSGLWMGVTNHKYGLELSYPALKVDVKTSGKYLDENIRGVATYPPAPI
jgi:hypothetical protein